MGYRRIDIPTLKNKQDIRDYKDLARRYTYCDKHITWPYMKDIGILLTSHPGNRGFLRSSIESHKKTKLWITLAYDNYFDSDRKDTTWNDLMPNRDVIDKVSCFIMGSNQNENREERDLKLKSYS